MSFFFFKQKTAYEMRISDWSSDVCSSDLLGGRGHRRIDVVVDQRKESLRQASQVPLRDLRLVAVGVAAGVIDRAEDGRRVVGVHERARPVVDRLAGDRHVVRSEEHTSELQSLMRTTDGIFCMHKKKRTS